MWTFRKRQDSEELKCLLSSSIEYIQREIEKNLPVFKCDICGKEIPIDLERKKADGRIFFLVKLERDQYGGQRPTREIKNFHILCRTCDKILTEKWEKSSEWKYESRELSFYVFAMPIENQAMYYKLETLLKYTPTTREDEVRMERFLSRTLTYRTALAEELSYILDRLKEIQEKLSFLHS